MPVYQYKAFDVKGKAASGLIEADSAKIARTRLRKQGIFPTEVNEQVGKSTRGAGLNREINVGQYFEFITTRDIAQTTTQLATMISASIPMVEALNALIEQTEKNKLKVILSRVKERVNEGATLADALAQHPKVFDDLFVQMVRAGEKSGSLDGVLRRLATYAEGQVSTQGKIVGAMAYPILMMGVGVLVIGGLFLTVIPNMRKIYTDRGINDQLPVVSKIVFGTADLFGWTWWMLPIVAIGGFFGFRRWVATKKGRERWDSIRLKLPLFGRVNRLIAVSRFCRTLGTLLLSGVPIVTALNISRNVVGNVIVAKAIDRAAENIQEGQSIAVPLKASGQFPPLVTHMIAIGEKTGELERMLNTVAEDYDGQVATALDAVTSILGPLVILAMGLVIFITAMALLLPMQTLMRSFN